MRTGTKVTVIMGVWKGHKAVVLSKKGMVLGKDQIYINIYDGPKIVININLVTK